MEIISYISKNRVDGNVYPIEYVNSNDESRKKDTNSVSDFTSCTIERDATISKYNMNGLTPSVLTTRE